MKPRRFTSPTNPIAVLAGLAGAILAIGHCPGSARAQASRPAAPEPAGTLLVVDIAGNRLVLVDTATRRIRASVATGEGPHEVEVSADGRRAFVANYGTRASAGQTLSVIDLAAGKEARRADLGAFRRPHGLALVDGKLYFTAEANRALGRYDPEADRVDRIVGLGQEATHMIVASPDGSTLFAANIGSGTVTALRRETGKLAHIAVGWDPEGIAVSPDGREVWAGRRTGGDVAIIDTSTLTVKATIRTGAGMAARLRFTPDGKRILLPDPAAGRLIVIDAATRLEIKSIAIGAGPVGALPDPAGRRAYVPLAGEGKVAVVDLETFTLAGSIETGPVSDGMAWASAP